MSPCLNWSQKLDWNRSVVKWQLWQYPFDLSSVQRCWATLAESLMPESGGFFFLRVWLQYRVEKFKKNFSSRNEDCIMQNCPFYISPNLLGVAANRQHSAGRFPSSGWHRRARAVGQSHGTMSDEMVPKPSSVPRSLSLFPSPLCFSLILSFSWILHFKWKVPLFSAWKSGCRLKDIFFSPFISVRKWACFWHQ